MRVFAATAMLLACLITTIQAAGGGKDGGGGKDDDSNCPCLDSIDLPNFQNQFIVSRCEARFPLVILRLIQIFPRLDSNSIKPAQSVHSPYRRLMTRRVSTETHHSFDPGVNSKSEYSLQECKLSHQTV